MAGTERLELSPDGWLIFAGRAVRCFGFGWLSVVLALYLESRGLSAPEIGAVFTATLVEDALLTTLLASVAARLGPARIMAAMAPTIALGGALLALAERPWLLMLGAVLGTLSPSGQEAGPFSPLEQALLPGALRRGRAVRAFGWYNVFGFLPSACGAGAAGLWLGWAGPRLGQPAALRAMLLAYAGSGLVLALVYLRLARRAPPAARPVAALGSFGLGRSRRAVLELAGLQAVDALAGGFILQALLAFWLHRRFGAGPEALGALFFGTSLLSAASFLVATRVAERIGLLRTMVFTHLPSNLLLLLIPFTPSFGAAAAVLLARHLLSQMDVPTRQAFAMALVAPDERPAASGLTASARSLAQACAPVLTGVAMGAAATALPFLLAGGLKIAYDLTLFFRFRNLGVEE